MLKLTDKKLRTSAFQTFAAIMLLCLGQTNCICNLSPCLIANIKGCSATQNTAFLSTVFQVGINNICALLSSDIKATSFILRPYCEGANNEIC